MVWSAYWWGIELKSENEADNQVLDTILLRLKREPEKAYEDGTLVVQTVDNLRVVKFSR